MPIARVDEAVARLVASMDANPYTGHALTIRDVVETVRYAYGDKAARSVKITVH
jgi:hypothetical protein